MKAGALSLIIAVGLFVSTNGAEFRGSQFIGWEQFTDFQKSDHEVVSPEVTPQVNWNELVLSWNYQGPAEDEITVEARVIYPEKISAWYTMGKWSGKNSRESVKHQRDEDARVDTDTLIAKRAGGKVQVRAKFRASGGIESLKFLGISLCDTSSGNEALAPNKKAWGKVLTVKERSQANYPEGISSWCSPTSTSMILSYWSTNLNRPELDYDVPEVARGVNDPNWPGTGNWPFNTAFAGAHRGIRAYVTRLSDVSELEEWVEAGLPVAVSVSYGLLRGKPERGNGHLVVCIGFTENGDIVVNDPGRSQVHQVYRRENLIRGWAESHNTVYLIYPEDRSVPLDRFHHWFTSDSRGDR
jgi:hypothetical protein